LGDQVWDPLNAHLPIPFDWLGVDGADIVEFTFDTKWPSDELTIPTRNRGGEMGERGGGGGEEGEERGGERSR
jgi:hypothetical protein